MLSKTLANLVVCWGFTSFLMFSTTMYEYPHWHTTRFAQHCGFAGAVSSADGVTVLDMWCAPDSESTSEIGAFVSLRYIEGLSRRSNLLAYTQTSNQQTRFLRKALVAPKDKTELTKLCGIVYELSCLDCDAVYIGRYKSGYQNTNSELAVPNPR